MLLEHQESANLISILKYGFFLISARIIIDGLLERNVGHIYAADCNEEQLQLTESLFSGKVG